MRHNVSGKKLGRDTSHRKALLRNLSDTLILNESIVTTVSKAKYVKPYIEKLITRAKNNQSFASIRVVSGKLYTKKASLKLFNELAPRFKDRQGGYTKITRVGNRGGDNAMLARIEFVEKEKVEKKVATKTKAATVKTPEKKVAAKSKKTTEKKSKTSVAEKKVEVKKEKKEKENE